MRCACKVTAHISRLFRLVFAESRFQLNRLARHRVRARFTLRAEAIARQVHATAIAIHASLPRSYYSTNKAARIFCEAAEVENTEALGVRSTELHASFVMTGFSPATTRGL